MSIRDWPADERPREKLLQRGAEALSDAELLAIFLRVGTRGKSAVDLARDVLTEFGSLRAMLSASQEEFCRAKGLGQATYVQLQANVEMTRRYLYQNIEQQPLLNDPASVTDFLTARLRDKKHEIFAVVWLNTQHHLIAYEELFEGSLRSASIYSREVVRAAIKHNAASAIFAHNHPSGIAEPSDADRQITEHLGNALQLIDVNVLDHIVIGSGQTRSFAQLGLL